MFQNFAESSPFHGLSISSHEPLHTLTTARSICPNCRKSFKYFCYRCLHVPEGLPLPQVSLPLTLELIKHEQELDSKSTAIHAKLLASTQTEIHNFHKQAPSHSQLAARIEASPPGTFVILFPDSEAVQLFELPADELAAVRAVIVIDGTWSQAAAINRTPPFATLRKICLDPSLRTAFWRYQSLGPHCLSTIEAIYYFMREFSRLKQEQGMELDDLLYFFSFFYHLIQDSYVSNPERKFTSRHRLDYIQRLNKDNRD